MTMHVLACSERVQAAMIGSPCRGLVLSAFASAANLSFPGGVLLSLNALPLPDAQMGKVLAMLKEQCRIGGAALLHFAEKQLLSWPLMPNGLLLSAHVGDFPFTALKAGMPVIMGAGWLTFETISCVLDCTSCPRWNPHIEPQPELDLRRLATHARLIAQFCQLHQPPGADILPIPETGSSLEMLAQTLCGRGPGLTPAGDDFLAGSLAAGWLLRGPQPGFLASCQRVNEIARQRTHALSQCWLAHAAAGDVAWPILVLLNALTGQDTAHLERATRNVLALGATSGYDLLQGMLYGLTFYRTL